MVMRAVTVRLPEPAETEVIEVPGVPGVPGGPGGPGGPWVPRLKLDPESEKIPNGV